MNAKKQTTLFQSWGSKKQDKSVSRTCNTGGSGVSGELIDLCDEDEDILIARAMEESLRDLEQHKGRNVSECSTTAYQDVRNEFSDDEGDLYGNMPLSEIPEATAIEDLPGFDNSAGSLWIYPTNYPVREYQFSIVKAALYKNTMVVLPTGLGKTFIAAVVMYNFYRWYPQGKVVFMAPTKPLVAQQIEACYNIMGIPQDDTAEMTGAMNPTDRKRSWERKRVFFLTPQVLTNDLNRSACPAESVKCLVVDEAHKATGNHAYCMVVKELIKYNEQFRILALSATPGSDIKAVQQVLSNLLISHIELKSEESPDIRQYSHERRVEKVVVPLGQELAQVKEKYLQIMTVVVNRLKRVGVLYNRDAKSFSKFLILKARESFRSDPPPNMQRSQFGAVEGDLALAMSLYHGFDLLQQHGLRSLYNYLDSILSGDKASARTKNELLKNANFKEIIDTLTAKFQPVKSAHPDAFTPSQFSPMRASQLAKPFAVGHPKMDKLKEIVLEHFNKYKNDGLETRIMIFSQFRDSVNEITEILNRHRPLVKVMSFIGQSVGKSSKGFSQKDQLRVMKQFREGGYNTLVSTCVGEEGLDIGDVDLIICFDAHKSPIRLVQRMGRTGRKREGRIVMLVTEGKEEQIYNQSQMSKRSIHKAIQNGAKSLHFYPNNPRMVPKGLTPNVHKMHITVHTKYDARAAKGKAATAVPQKSHITGMLQTKGTRSKSRNVDKKDGFLTPQELEYWSERFCVNDMDIPTLPQTEYLSLSKNDKKNIAGSKKNVSPHKILSLSNWMPWQNRLQDTRLSGHSLRSQHLVNIMEFMDIQNAVESGGDHYGAEMQMYLNEEDIIRPQQSDNTNRDSILKYCTQKSTQNGVAKRQNRRSTVLPDLSSEEDELASEDELPGLHDVMTGKGKQTKKVVASRSPVTNDFSAKNRSEDKHMSHDQTVCHMEHSSDKIIQKAASERKKGIQDVSFIQVIEDKDSQDFETDNNGNIEPYASKTDTVKHLPKSPTVVRSPLLNGNFDLHMSDVMPELPPLAHIEDEPMECTEERDLEMDTKIHSCDNTSDPSEKTKGKSSTFDEEEEKRLSELLPDFTGRVKASHAADRGTVEKCSDSALGGFVRPPPSLEEVDIIMGELDKQECLSPVDVLDLIDKWEAERPNDLERNRHSICKTNKEAEEVYGNGTVDTGCQTKVRGSVKVNTKSLEKAKVSETTISISVHPTEEKSRLQRVTRELTSVECGKGLNVRTDKCDESHTEVGEKFQEKYAKENDYTCSDSGLIDGMKEEIFHDDCSFGGRNVPVSPIKSQMVRKPLFKKSPLPSTTCVAEKSLDKQADEVNTDNCQVDTSLFTDVDAHDFSFPLTDEKGLSEAPFKSYNIDTPGDKPDKVLPQDNKESQGDFVKASDLLVTPGNGKRKHSHSSDEYSPTFDARRCTNNLTTSTPALVKSADRLKLTIDQFQDSFFNQEDDVLLEKMKTAHPMVECEEKVPVEPNMGPIKSSEKQKGLATVKNLSLNSTQITFTQALAFADESLNSSHTYSTTGSSHSFIEDGVNSNTRLKNKQVSQSSHDISKHNMHVKSAHDTPIITSEKEIHPVCQTEGTTATVTNADQIKAEVQGETEEDFGPHFDLGFDFDDDLEDVIPPSPVRSTQPFSQVPVLSKSGAGNVTTEPFSSQQGGGEKSPSLIGGLGVKFSQKPPEALRESESNKGNKGNVSSAVSGNSCHDNVNCFTGEDAEFVKVFEEFLDKSGSCDQRIKSDTSEENVSMSVLCQVPKLHSKNKSDKNSDKNGGKFSLFGNRNRNSTESGSSEDSTSILLSLKDQMLKSPEKLSVTNEMSHSDLEESDSLLLIPKCTTINRLKKNGVRHSLIKDNVNSSSTPVARVQPQHQREERYNKLSSGQSRKTDGTEFEDMETLEVSAADFESSLHCEVDVEGLNEMSNMRLQQSGSRHIEVEQSKAGGLSVTCEGFKDDMNSDLDESIIQVKRKKKAVALVTSPETPVCEMQGRRLDDTEFKTPLKPAAGTKRTRKLLSSDEDDEGNVSVLTMDTKRRKTLSFASELSDDDFEDYRQPVKGAVSRSTGGNVKVDKWYHKKKKPGCGFIEEEAELSGDSRHSSDDEDGSDLDQLDDSFVNDATQLTQAVAESDMHAVYMRSIKSPEGASFQMPERYRLKHNPNLSVFSQLPDDPEGDSCYMEDSFVVGSDHEFGDSEFVDDHTIVEAAILPTSRRRCTRNAYSNHVMLAKLKCKKLTKDSSRKRIKRIQCSSSSDDDGERNRTVNECKGSKPRISSSGSETSAQVLQHKSPEPSPLRNKYSVAVSRNSDVKSTVSSPPLSGYTQIESLQTRCRQRMQTNRSLTGSTHNGGINNSAQNLPEKKSTDDIYQQKKNYNECKIMGNQVEDQNGADFDLSFDLGMDDISEEGDNGKKNDGRLSSGKLPLCKSSSHSPIQTSICSQSAVPSSSNRSNVGSNLSHVTTSNARIDLQSISRGSHIYSASSATSKSVSPRSDTSFSGSQDHNNKLSCGLNAVNESLTKTSPGVGQPILKSVSSSPSKQPMTKEERLRLSKQRQEEFKRKYANKIERSHDSSDHVTILDHTLPPEPKKFGMYSSPTPSSILSDITQADSSKGHGFVVFVDSREINGAQDVISVLRAKHHHHTDITQLQGCDYIISHRMAVERKVLSDFTNGANKSKLVERVRQMREMCEKSVLVVEKDRLKTGERDTSKPMLKSKYVESMLASLCQMQVKVYFSESQENTADVLAQLIDIEQRKGFGITYRKALSQSQTQLLKFYLSIPKVSHITAVNFLHGYRTLKEFINSPVAVIEKKGKINREKAAQIFRYLQHQFDPQMLVIKR